MLEDDERTAGDIARRFDVTRRWYRARPEGLAEVRAYRAPSAI
jgi:hypothetical protein